MTQALRDLMTPEPVILDAKASVAQAAGEMRRRNVGDVLVRENGKLCGIVTDRDLAVRSCAEGRDPRSQPLEELCTRDLATIDVDGSVDDAINVMRERAIRRVPVLERGAPIGIVSLGDLAQARDPGSALGAISAAPATR